MANAFKAIRRVELIKGGYTIKQGEIFTLGFHLYDSDGVIIVPTVGQTISVKIANLTGVIYETNATVVENHIEFTVNENLGYGQMNVELKVTEGTTLIEKYPADDFIKLKITKSLDDANVGNITAISAEQMRSEISAIETSVGTALIDAAESKALSLDTQTQLDTIILESGTSDAETIQARGTETLLYKRLDKTDQKLADMDTYVDATVFDKISKGEFISDYFDTSSNDYKLKPIHVSDELMEMFSPGGTVNPVIADGGITATKYADGSISRAKLDSSIDYEQSATGGHLVYSAKQFNDALGFVAAVGWSKTSFAANAEMLIGDHLTQIQFTTAGGNYYRFTPVHTVNTAIHKRYSKISILVNYKGTAVGVAETQVRVGYNDGAAKAATIGVLKKDGLERSEVFEFVYNNQAPMVNFYFYIQGGDVGDIIKLSYITSYYGKKNDNVFAVQELKKYVDVIKVNAEKALVDANNAIDDVNTTLADYDSQSVTQAIADSQSALANANQAVQTANDTQTQLNSIVIASGTSDAETIQARGSFDLLNERLEDSDERILLESDVIRGANKPILFNTDGTIQKVQFIRSLDDTIVREDVFTYGNNSITEVRTLLSGSTMTIIYNLETLETEVI